ncbi:MAG TPA: twin-arginine translocase TatA/TatE family subunit [Alphaproteobacteria bacterium]|mgnify:CR=1 FL=1|nr:twin-arginine translocase TatA/TatE family subunit [Alphaproteobacteria bacterium]
MRTGFWEIFLIIILVLILFGHAKIPDVMKNLANGINVFKKELKGTNTEKEPSKKQATKKPAVKKTVKK